MLLYSLRSASSLSFSHMTEYINESLSPHDYLVHFQLPTLPTVHDSTAVIATYKSLTPTSSPTTSSRTICAEIVHVIGLLYGQGIICIQLSATTKFRLTGQTVHKFGIAQFFIVMVHSCPESHH